MVFVGCSYGTKKPVSSIIIQKFITVVDKNDYCVAYTEDGHTFIYEKNYANNFILYYTKFDEDAGKYGNDRIKDKIIRVEIDSTLDTLKSIMSVHGGAFCTKKDFAGYEIYCFDDQMNAKYIERVEVPIESEYSKERIEDEIKRIIEVLDIADKIALSINEYNVSGWNYIVSALEPSLCLPTYDVTTNDIINDTKAKNRIAKIKNTIEGLTHFNNLLFEKMNEQKGKTDFHNDCNHSK